MKPWLLVTESGGVQRIRFNRPEQLNTYDHGNLLQLSELFERASERDDLGAILLEGEGGAFCAGHDLYELRTMALRGDAQSYRRMLEGLRDLILKVPRLPQIVIAVVRGTAAGGGCNLALTADICLASGKAGFGHPAVSLGFPSELGATQLLQRALGIPTTLELLTTGRLLDGPAAAGRGLARLETDPSAVATDIAARAHLMPAEVRQQLKRTVYKAGPGWTEKDFEPELEARVRFFLSDRCRAAFDRAGEAGAELE